MRGLRDFPATLSSEEEELDLVLSPALYPLHHRPFQTSTCLNSSQELKSWLASEGMKKPAANSGAASLFLPSSKRNSYHISANSCCQRQITLTGGSVSYIREIYLQKQQAQNLFFNSCDFIKQLYLAAP